MKISRLVLDGFKSFARRQVFDFHDGVTGVVGPNGCGKSNIVDAIRWVLGERSRKDLRMKASTDVIFAGTSNKRAGRYAKVEVTFDNSDGSIPNLGAEFTISRKLLTTGESQYKINNREAKRREISDILAGTGVGPDGFTVMGQGKIDELLRNNPTERRKIFEEAAGISQYRSQKSSTENKLQVVAVNLERLQDKINESRNRLRSIKGQASRALKYKEYTERLKMLRTQLSLHQFHRISREREDFLISVNDLGRREGQLQKQLSATRMEAESFADSLKQQEESLETLRSELHNAELELGRGEGRRNESAARIEGLERSRERLEQDVERLKEQVQALRGRREELSKATDKYRGEIENAQSRLSEAQEAESESAKREADLERSIKGQRDAHLAKLYDRNGFLNEEQRLESELKSISQQSLKLKQRSNELESQTTGSDQRIEKAREAHAEEVKQLEALKESFHAAEADIRQFNTLLSDLRSQRHNIQMDVSGLESRVKHLENLERMLEGVEKGSRKLVQEDKLRERFGVLGLVADVVEADISIAPALEKALGEFASGVIVENQLQAYDAVDYLARNEGEAATVLIRERFSALAPTPRFPTGQGILGPLLGEVEVKDGFAPIITKLLSNWLLVADRDVARRVAKDLEAGIKLVTPTGEVFTESSATLPSSDRLGGVVTQRSELERLRQELTEQKAEAETLGETIDDQVRQVQKKNDELTGLRQAIYDRNVSELEARGHLKNVQNQCAQAQEELSTIKSELTSLQDEAKQNRERLEEVQSGITSANEEIARIEGGIEELTSQRAELDEDLRQKADAVVSRRIELAELKSNLNAVEKTAQELEKTESGFQNRMQGDIRDIAIAEKQIESLRQGILDIERGEDALKAQVEAQRISLEKGTTEIEEVRGRFAIYQEKERSLNNQLLQLKEEASALKLESEKCFLQLNALRERMINDFSVDLDVAYRDFDPLKRANFDEAAVTEEIDTIAHSLSRLGPVNMEAVGELEEVEERYRLHSRQEKDLLRAKKALEDAIERIESEARRRFLHTFETTREHFQRLFRKMFGGGSADMMLLNPEDVLESGIEVMAKPPGMQPKSLNLLSGGQRTMIACAMMFALFQTSNAPFALLDEVDAALDDANVERFCTLLREYAGTAQFIIITHHKKTMAHTDRLYGVTMQERGVSLKVAVDLSESYEIDEEMLVA